MQCVCVCACVLEGAIARPSMLVARLVGRPALALALFWCWRVPAATSRHALVLARSSSLQIWDPARSEDGCPQDDVTAAAEGVTVYFEQDCTPLCTGGETAPPGEGTCTADIQYEANLQGGDLSGELSTVVVADWAECCALCASTADCYAW